MIQALLMVRKLKHASMKSQRRAAFTLVETIVVTAVSSVVLGIVVSLLVALQRHDQSIRRHAFRNDQVARLAEAVRADIRRGTTVAAPSANEFVVAGVGGGDIHFKIAPEGCARTTTANAGATPSRELFSVGPASAWQIDSEHAGRKPLYTVSLVGKDDMAGEASKPLVVVQAALGADTLPEMTN
jgi:type II secretory pathway pseudopilin PulG